MKLLVFFGLPGSGKTFVSQVANEYFGYDMYDGDLDLTEELLDAFKKKAVVTDAMRDVFFAKLMKSVKKISQKYDKLVVSQTFIKEKYRRQFLSSFPQTEFVLIEAPALVRENRLIARKTMQLDIQYTRKMAQIFEKPSIVHHIVQNKREGKDEIKKQLEKILQ
jgi:gluconate kinase